MISAKAVCFSAILTSMGTLIATLYYVPPIIVKIIQINEQVKSDAEEFRAIADDTWDQLTWSSQRHHRQVESSLPDTYYLSNNYVNKGSSPQTAICACEEVNSCPPGSRGSPGKQGNDGLPGADGRPGAPGLPGNAAPVTTDTIAGCRICPSGPPGPLGHPGQIGFAGEHGTTGKAGKVGDVGRPGYQGNPGTPGDLGKHGKAGESGPPGQLGIYGSRGLRGMKGKTGLPGFDGSAGYSGLDGLPGQEGHVGPLGDAGPPGIPGPQGLRGLQGMMGPPGDDADYCLCPARTRATDIDKRIDSAYQQTISNQTPTTEKSPAKAPAYEPPEPAAGYAAIP